MIKKPTSVALDTIFLLWSVRGNEHLSNPLGSYVTRRDQLLALHY